MFPDYTQVTMPDVYQPGDAEFIQKILAAMKSASMREYARDKYAYVYKLRWDEEPVSYRKGNAGAKAANTWLRLFFNKNHRSMQGYTEKPIAVSGKQAV
ncbi:hypothetical protein [Xenorhabdus sp. Sc-CR9]|uniref:hypothetical protein n=1 Tax=Xenorhabdus sp. Sc-CR9 TaxID=2584468 RepID=UPI001F22A431|nr:hypothetical protein [Xenorhabdus sp. Sc-CR9]